MLLQQKYLPVVRLLVIAILCCGPLDVLTNGFKILDPASYAELSSIGRYVRHVSSLCWTLIPIAFVYYSNNRKVRLSIVMYALIFPILIVDRNRLFLSFYSLALCIAASNPQFRLKHAVSLVVALLLVFGIVGLFRSGSEAFMVESSGDFIKEGMYPLRSYYYYLPQQIQQIVLYITTPLFNFATVLSTDFRSDTFLLSQISPFNRESFELYPYSPILIPRFNVGTEFFPWLLYGGFLWVIFPVFIMILTFFWSVSLHKKYRNMYTFLIFIKISHTVLFSAFAPQFFILLNFAFIVMMIGLWSLSSLKSKNL